MKLTVGSTIRARQLTAVSGAMIEIPDGHDVIHLQFRRFAGCPVCNLHLRSFARRVDDLTSASVREVVVFHAPDDD
ncbi:MAG TPA: AhpC/TSA family protein, partial [Streptosporangiaceae bacterium]